MNEIKIEDYLHLYYHCDGELETNDRVIFEGRVGSLWNNFLPSSWKSIKPILRPISDMTEEEMLESKLFARDHKNRLMPFRSLSAFTPGQFIYLLSKGFDLFGLIPAGLAINKLTVTSKD